VCEDHPALASEYEDKAEEKVACSGEPGSEVSKQQDKMDIKVGVMTLECGGATRVFKDISKVKKVKGGKRRVKHLVKPEVIEEVEDMWTEVIGSDGEERGVEEEGGTLVGRKSLSENEETTPGKMESAFEDPSARYLEEPSVRLQDLAKMEEYVILLSDLPVIELNFNESDVEFDDSGIEMTGSSGEVDSLEDEWKSEKEADLATCFGFDEYFGSDEDPSA